MVSNVDHQVPSRRWQSFPAWWELHCFPLLHLSLRENKSGLVKLAREPNLNKGFIEALSSSSIALEFSFRRSLVIFSSSFGPEDVFQLRLWGAAQSGVPYRRYADFLKSDFATSTAYE